MTYNAQRLPEGHYPDPVSNSLRPVPEGMYWNFDTQSLAPKIEDTDEAWDSGQLGRDERYVRVVPADSVLGCGIDPKR